MMIGMLIPEPANQAKAEPDFQTPILTQCGRVIMYAVLLIPWVVLFRRLLGTPKPAHQIASPSPPQPPPNPPTPKPRVTMSRRP
jgi:hypothetical protein